MRGHVCESDDVRSGQACPLPTSPSRWWFSYPFSHSGRGETPLYPWLPKAQPVLQIRRLQSALPSPLPPNLLITSSISLFHQDKPNRSRVYQGGVVGMGQPMVFGIKNVSFPIVVSQCRLARHHNQPTTSLGFVNAQYRFVMNPLGDYTVHFADPDM